MNEIFKPSIESISTLSCYIHKKTVISEVL